MIKRLTFISRNLSAPLWIYAALLGSAILCCFLYAGLKGEVGKNIALSFFSSLTGILITAVCIDFTASRRRAKETYEIRKAILIRCNYILYLLIDLWSCLVESAIKKYNHENIFSYTIYKLVTERVDMACFGQGMLISLIDLYDQKRINIQRLINNWIQTYGSHIDPILLSFLTKIELSNMVHYSAHDQSVKQDTNWTQYIFSDPPFEHTPVRFSLSWDKVECDFSLFRDFEGRIATLSQEFNDDIHLYSLESPFFKTFPPHEDTRDYKYDPYYDIAKKYQINYMLQEFNRIKELISTLMESQGVSIPKTRAQSLFDALREAHHKEQAAQKASQPTTSVPQDSPVSSAKPEKK